MQFAVGGIRKYSPQLSASWSSSSSLYRRRINTSSRFTCDEVLPSKWSIACAITKSAVDIGRRAAGRRNISICRLLIQTTHTCSVPLQYLERSTAAVDLMVERQKPYIAGESITSSCFTCDEVLPSKWSIACAITISAVDIGRRAAGQVNTSICRLLIQTTQTGSLPLRYLMITAAVDLMIEQQ